jgi:hypothetical protein
LDAFTSSGFYLGTDRLGRALTDDEKKRLALVLREHDFVGCSSVALRFAFKLTRGHGGARDLLGRVNLRLVRTGWDPNVVELRKRLCRLVWSEHTHQIEEDAVTRRAEELHIREEAIHGYQHQAAAARGDPLKPHTIARSADERGAPIAPSYEMMLERQDGERQDEARAYAFLEEQRASLAALRAGFVKKKDRVNVAYLDLWMKGVTEVAEMVKESPHSAEDFYAAQKRRQRAVGKLLAAKGGPAVEGADDDDEENV